MLKSRGTTSKAKWLKEQILATLMALITLVVLVSISTQYDISQLAFAETIDIKSDPIHSLDITAEEGTPIPTFDGFVWTLTGGIYTVTGISQPSEGLKITGDATVNLKNATIDHSAPNPTRYTTANDVAKYAPAISIESGSTRINLAGTNKTAGAPGYAGIYVAENATLTITGDGSLTAVGGNACPDIGFYDGGWLYGVPLPNEFGAGEGVGERTGEDIGEGTSEGTNEGAEKGVGENQRGFFTGGAGIGGNGTWVKLVQPSNPNLCEKIPNDPSTGDPSTGGSSNFGTANFGTVRVNNGIINATGGSSSDREAFGAGAGIGSGGGTGVATPTDTYWSMNNPFSGTVEINGGDITATGGISISYFKAGGGAGIGTGGVTGNRYYCNNDVEISINGGQVTATGKSNGAGIGGGDNIPSGIIEITDGSITANGGDCRNDSPRSGGAGIGGGDGDWNYVWFIDISGGTIIATGAGDAAGIGTGNDGWLYGDIYFRGSANVTAYGGYGKNGGNGVDANSIHLWDQATVRAYGNINGKGISYGNNFDMSGITSLWMQTETPNEPAISNLLGSTYNSSSTYLVTNWNYQTDPLDPDVACGWFNLPSNNKSGDKQFRYAWTDDGLTIDGNLIPLSKGLHPANGSWAALYSEPYEVNVLYKYIDENYPDEVQETLPNPAISMSNVGFTAYAPAEVDGWIFDGWYTDEDCTVEFIDGTILTTDTTLYGRWDPNAIPVDPIMVTLSYDLNQGTGMSTVFYAPESVKYGESIVVKPAPTRDGYTFYGWSDGVNTYMPGDVIVLTANTVLIATWSRTSSTPGSRIIRKLVRLPSTGDNAHFCLIGLIAALCSSVLALVLAIKRMRSVDKVDK